MRYMGETLVYYSFNYSEAIVGSHPGMRCCGGYYIQHGRAMSDATLCNVSYIQTFHCLHVVSPTLIYIYTALLVPNTYNFPVEGCTGSASLA